MSNKELTQEDKIFIRTVFKEMRKKTQAYMDDRDFHMSNAQLFLFLSNAPAALAIAGDGEVDETEIQAIEDLSAFINVGNSVDLALQEMMAIAVEPDETMLNQEFNIRIGSELLYLSRNIQKYESDIIAAIKAMLTFGLNSKDGSLSTAISKLMDMVVENNFSKNKEEETEKMNKIKAELGIL